jgi:hypothetical protein
VPKGPGPVVNVRSVAEGQQFLPGNEVLMPFDEATKAWKAYNGGAETWAAYLQSVEGQLTKAAFENATVRARGIGPARDAVAASRA